MTKLVIVESPTKAKTISKFLTKDFKIESSFGHIRDLPAKKLGVDVDKNFEPQYVIPLKSKKRVNELKKLAAQADQIYFATDEDREGEAIAWHLVQILATPADQAQRITFHEITEEAIKEALKKPRSLDLNLINAQQARRILDRLVGYELSPFLWKKVAKGLSAGRVQSVAVRLIVEREREIKKFKVEEYWEIFGRFLSKQKKEFTAKLHSINGKTLEKLAIKSKEKADQLLAELKQKKYRVTQLIKKELKRQAPAPFTTASLQQEANRRLGYSAKQTMMIAQQLYEGVEINGEATGLITYMRTDSLNLSSKFINEAADLIKKNWGQEYLEIKKYKTKNKTAQEAHEAIRPTAANRRPESLTNSLNKNQLKLYQLIWQRAMASQMTAAKLDATVAEISDDQQKYTFRANGQTIKFEGFLKIYPSSLKDEILPSLQEGDAIKNELIEGIQKFTQPPARYSDASLVKALEERGIGRPSTYAPTIATIIDRGYVERMEKRRLKPTEIALIVNDLLVQHFPNIVDYNFTAQMEDNLDKIAAGQIQWQPVLKTFYLPFKENLKNKERELSKKEITEKTTNEICEKCGAAMVNKVGRFGRFLACSNYPKCKNTKKINGENQQTEEPKILEEKCPECGANLVLRQGRYGQFKGCANYPKCKFIKKENQPSLDLDCPRCKKGKIATKRSRRGIFYGCDQYPACDFAFWGKPTGDPCPQCGYPLVTDKNNRVKCSNKDCQS